jgi:hypothetical protein
MARWMFAFVLIIIGCGSSQRRAQPQPQAQAAAGLDCPTTCERYADCQDDDATCVDTCEQMAPADRNAWVAELDEDSDCNRLFPDD